VQHIPAVPQERKQQLLQGADLLTQAAVTAALCYGGLMDLAERQLQHCYDAGARATAYSAARLCWQLLRSLLLGDWIVHILMAAVGQQTDAPPDSSSSSSSSSSSAGTPATAPASPQSCNPVAHWTRRWLLLQTAPARLTEAASCSIQSWTCLMQTWWSCCAN
jgi:hypothetical protein